MRLAVVVLGLLSLPGYAVDLRAAVRSEMHGMTWYVWLFAGQFVLYLVASLALRTARHSGSLARAES